MKKSKQTTPKGMITSEEMGKRVQKIITGEKMGKMVQKTTHVPTAREMEVK